MASKSLPGNSVCDDLWSCFMGAEGTRKGVQNRLGATHSCSMSHRAKRRWSRSANWQSREWVMEHMGYWLLMETIMVSMITVIIHFGVFGKTN